MDITTIKQLVGQARERYIIISKREWEKDMQRSTGDTAMWQEASLLAPKEWREVIRVLAQGGDYYEIEWPS